MVTPTGSLFPVLGLSLAAILLLSVLAWQFVGADKGRDDVTVVASDASIAGSVTGPASSNSAPKEPPISAQERDRAIRIVSDQESHTSPAERAAAISLLERAAANDDLRSMKALGDLFRAERGSSAAIDQAVEYYSLAAEAGDKGSAITL
jgi:TPR repeat protein